MLILFTTSTCPRCPEFKGLVRQYAKELDIRVIEKSDYDEDFFVEAKRFGIEHVPTLVCIDDDSVSDRTSDPSQVLDFLKRWS